jgi:glutathione S-transferase
MLPADPLEKAHARAWVEYGTALLQDCFALTAAADEESLNTILGNVTARLDRLEREIQGTFFLGEAMSLVDAAFVPALQRLKFADELKPDMALFGDHRPRVTRWWQAIEARPSVPASAPADIRERFYAMIGRDRGGYRSVIGKLAAAGSPGG